MQKPTRNTLTTFLAPRNLLVAILSVAVLGLGVYIFENGSTAAPTPSANNPSLNALAADSGLLDLNAKAPLKTELTALFAFFPRDVNLTWPQIALELKAGKTLAQIAGPHTQQVETDAINELTLGFTLIQSQGVITPDQENRLVADAKDALDVLMNARLSNLAALIPTPAPLP